MVSEFCAKTDIFCDDKTTHGYWNKDHNQPTVGEVAFTSIEKQSFIDDDLFFWENKIYDPKLPPINPVNGNVGLLGKDYYTDTGLPPKAGDRIYVRILIVNHHQLAFQLAINHTIAEIKKLYDATAGLQFPINNPTGNDTSLSLHDVFLLQDDFANHNIAYDTLYDKNNAGGIK